MNRWALIFFIVAILAGLFGFNIVDAGAGGIGKVLFFLCLGLALVMLVIGALRAKPAS